MARRKLAILSDHPGGPTGLGRVTRELALRIDEDLKDEFDLAVIADGGAPGNFPFPVYPAGFSKLDHSAQNLPYIWEEHCGVEPGILLTIMNPGWLRWLADPEILAPGPLRAFLNRSRKTYRLMDIWAYVPVDAEGLHGRLSPLEISILEKFDRVLAYTKFGAAVICRSLNREIDHLPHGTDSSIFYPRSREEARKRQFLPRVLGQMGEVSSKTFLLGCVATNTARKDWPLAFETCAELRGRGYDLGLWAHVPRLVEHWNLLDLADGFGMHEHTIFTSSSLPNETMAWAYAACDVTLGIGSGEGWGLPLSESLACGVPVVHGNYAGATDFIPPEMLVDPFAWRYEGIYNAKRPIFRATDWADRIAWLKGRPAKLDPKFTWDGCWPAWRDWLVAGSKCDEH